MEALSISDRHLCDKIKEIIGPQACGTYTLIGLGADGRPVTIPRWLGSDPDGILYYGTSEYLFVRVGQLRATICAIYQQEGYQSGNHSGGWKLAKLPRVKELFPTYDRYRIEVRACQEFRDTGEPHWSKYEGELLETYRLKYGEVPPLNG